MKWLKDLGRQFDKNVTQKIVGGVKQAGRDIDKAIIRPTTDAIGLTDKRIPDEYKPQVDPQAQAAHRQFGENLQKQGQSFDPSKYGDNYFQPRTMQPQITQTGQHRPGIWSPQQRAPQAAGPQQAPDMNMEGDQRNMQLHNLTTGTGANTYQQQNAINQELKNLQQPYNLQAGYNPEMRQTYIDMATSGLEQQKEAAMAQLKEQQMASGNFGSSVGQKQMMELQKDYDRQITQAGKEADFMQMGAERDDRYRNIGVEQSRVGMVGNLAGQGANMNLATQGYQRDTLQLQNQAQMIMDQYAREGRQIDNATAMQMAQFVAGQQQQHFGNQMATHQANQQADMASYDSEYRNYQDIKEAGRYGDQIANQANLFNIGQQDTADLRNYGSFQDYMRGMSQYGSNQMDPTSMENYKLYQQQQADKNARFGNFLNTGYNIANLAMGGG